MSRAMLNLLHGCRTKRKCQKLQSIRSNRSVVYGDRSQCTAVYVDRSNRVVNSGFMYVSYSEIDVLPHIHQVESPAHGTSFVSENTH